MDKPLRGVRVLAVEQYGAGPFGTQHLADLGAEIVKVENRNTGGDYARGLGPFFAGDSEASDASLYFQSFNRNKKSLSLDLSGPKGRAVLHRLAPHFDSVANNLRGDVPEKLGITYDALKAANPAIVCAHCSAYGRAGPRRDWPGYDFLMQAEAGYFAMSGEPDAPPARMGLSLVDYMGGTYMALALVSAVLAARSTGQGRDVDVNLFDTALYNYSYLGAWALNSDYAPGRNPRSAHPSLVPCQLYRTGDGWIYLMCNKQKFWPALCAALDADDLATDPRFAEFDGRLAHRDLLTELLDDKLSARTTGDWLERFAGKVPAAPVLAPREALNTPFVRGRGRVQSLTVTDGTSFDVLASPVDAGSTDSVGDRACPPLGADTRKTLHAAGFSEAEIEALERDRVI